MSTASKLPTSNKNNANPTSTAKVTTVSTNPKGVTKNDAKKVWTLMPGGTTPALFVSKQSYRNDQDQVVDTWRGSCYKACPNGYFINN